MILDIDVGNTRVKWRLLGEAGVCGRGASLHGCEMWAFLHDFDGADVRRVRVSNVAGAGVAENLNRQVGQLFGIVPEFATALTECSGLTSGYEQSERLGVDRWLAMLAAWNTIRRACVVVDAGSALTIDFVDKTGAHVGGYIAPGWRMLIEALCNGTNGVKVNSAKSGELRPGRSTETAVINGCAAMITTFCREVTELGMDEVEECDLFLTGGDSKWLKEYLPGNCRYEPDLVLNGLAYGLA